jgi:hypothetical protein
MVISIDARDGSLPDFGPERRRRAKTDAIDGETLLRTLLAWMRGDRM